MKTVKIIAALLLMAAVTFMLAACGNAPSGNTTTTAPATTAAKATDATPAEAPRTTAQAAETEANGSKTLVVYFSATGTTKGVAEQIAAAANADTYEILAAQTYTADDLN